MTYIIDFPRRTRRIVKIDRDMYFCGDYNNYTKDNTHKIDVIKQNRRRYETKSKSAEQYADETNKILLKLKKLSDELGSNNNSNK